MWRSSRDHDLDLDLAACKTSIGRVPLYLSTDASCSGAAAPAAYSSAASSRGLTRAHSELSTGETGAVSLELLQPHKRL